MKDRPGKANQTATGAAADATVVLGTHVRSAAEELANGRRRRDVVNESVITE